MVRMLRRRLSNKVIGRDRICPLCGGYNRSGTNVPKDCMWCSKYAKEERSKAYKRALKGARELKHDKEKKDWV